MDHTSEHPICSVQGGLEICFVDYDFVCSSVCPILHVQVKIWHRWHGRWANWQNSRTAVDDINHVVSNHHGRPVCIPVTTQELSCSKKCLEKELKLCFLSLSGGCLSAPAEVSLWTKFCELGLPSAINQIGRMEMGGGGGR